MAPDANPHMSRIPTEIVKEFALYLPTTDCKAWRKTARFAAFSLDIVWLLRQRHTMFITMCECGGDDFALALVSSYRIPDERLDEVFSPKSTSNLKCWTEEAIRRRDGLMLGLCTDVFVSASSGRQWARLPTELIDSFGSAVKARWMLGLRLIKAAFDGDNWGTWNAVDAVMASIIEELAAEGTHLDFLEYVLGNAHVLCRWPPTFGYNDWFGHFAKYLVKLEETARIRCLIVVRRHLGWGPFHHFEEEKKANLLNLILNKDDVRRLPYLPAQTPRHEILKHTVTYQYPKLTEEVLKQRESQRKAAGSIFWQLRRFYDKEGLETFPCAVIIRAISAVEESTRNTEEAKEILRICLQSSIFGSVMSEVVDRCFRENWDIALQVILDV
ncbi:hypothetical protein HDV00_004923 [Rhizophlyctis rosea]|nr:hypothetical protein HDV00_004923 [Rhizophlyctis rosea]